MKYAVRYDSSFKYLDEVDEIIIDYPKIDNIVEFASKKIQPNQKLIINLDWFDLKIEDVIPYLNELKKEHSNFMVQIGSIEQRDFISILKDNEIDFMFGAADVCTDFGSLYSAIKAGAKEAYIAEDICFDLVELQRARKHLKLRVFPDIAQTNYNYKKDIPNLTKFFIRPEDTEVYEDYIDVFEFYHTNDRLSVIYEIYKNRRWLGNINQIIDNCDLDLDNTTIAPYFAPHRLNCRRRCLIDESYCNMCYQIANLGEKFEDAGITINRSKYKEEITEEEKQKLLDQLMKFGKMVDKRREDDKFTSD